ncbi:MAG TPA: ABC transporter ATP-binding protein [Pseudolabrys sp.]|nr:ABC transporter ATP-binding protein [Pseudolabrys sp.]
MTGRRAISLRSIGKMFNRGVRALDGFALEVHESEFVSLLGPSGCGKSTVLRIIAGLTAPTGGSVDWPDGAAKIGFVFQEPTLMPWCNVEANVRLPLKLAGVAGNASVGSTLERVGLAEFGEAFPRELSGGMKMRASIARALVTEPQLLLMDEPFAALDEITRFKLNNDLLALWQDLHPTVIFVTHSVFESVYLSQRIVVMTPRPGRVFTEIEIPAAYPRGEDFRTSAEYAGLCRKVAQALGEAMSRGAP